MNNRRAVLIVLMMGVSMAALDSSIVNVSLPVIQRQFSVSITQIEWVITGYMISFCLFIPLINWLKSAVGYYHLFIYSVAIFTTGSLLCSLSGNIGVLIIARVFQAIGGGAIAPVSLAILSEVFPREERGSAIGWWGIGNVMGPAVGPTLGGVLTHYFGWPSIFYINIPIGILTIALSMRYMGFLRVKPVSQSQFDIAGYTFFALFIGLFQYSITLVSQAGIPALWYIIGFALSCIFLWLFIRSSRKPNPLIDLGVFKSGIFVRCSIIILIRSLALFGGLFFIPFLLQGLMGYSEIDTGLLLLPNALMMLFLRPYAGRLADRGLIRNPSVAGIVLIAVSMLQFSFLGVGSPAVLIIVAMIVRGVGMGLLVAPVSTSLLNAVISNQTATATSLNSLLQQVGGSIGIAGSGVLHVWFKQHYISAGKPVLLAEHFALKDGFMVSAAIIACSLFPAFGLPEKRKGSVSVEVEKVQVSLTHV